MHLKRYFPHLGLAALGLFIIVNAHAESGAKEAIAAGATLIDVRTPQEFVEGHLKGAVNIPVDVLESKLLEVGPKDKPVVVYCRSGKRSARAKGILTKAGFSKVFDLGAMSNGD